VGGLGLLVGLSLLIVTQIFAADVAGWLGLGGQYELTVNILRFPILLIVVMATVSFVYWQAPNTGVPFKWITPGAVLFTVAWAIFTVAFAIYVANFSSYNATYGALGGVVVLLLWLYVTSLLMVAGAELNAVIEEQRSPEVMRERREAVARELEARGHPLPRRSPGEASGPSGSSRSNESGPGERSTSQR
jgi:membrane protein